MLTNLFGELLDRDRRAVVATMELVSQMEAADLARPTPCDGWSLYDLLTHMTGQQIGFAAAARGRGGDRATWAASDRRYTDACVDVISAFAAPKVRNAGFALPEIRDGGIFPAPIAISFHLVDNVVHAWDIAASLGLSPTLDEDVVSAALRVAERVPNGPDRMRSGSAFAPGSIDDCDNTTLERTVRLLGRSPSWVADHHVALSGGSLREAPLT